MRVSILLRNFLDDLRAQRMRTALTVLGITWGTVAVVVMLSFGAGLEKQMKVNARGIGEGIVIVFGGRTTKAHQGFPDGRFIPLREEDVEMLAREIPEIAHISPEYGARTAVRRGTSSANPYVTGIAPVYGEMRNIHVVRGGRFIDTLDIADRRRVAVLGDELKTLLFGESQAVGDQIFIRDVPFTVVGVMAKKTQNSSYNSRDQDRIFIPVTTHRSVFGARNLNNIIYRPADPTASARIKLRLYELMGSRYKFDPSDDDALTVWDTQEQMKFFKYLFLGFNLFLGVVGSFTLVVGGIGVANIMYVVVRERTHEIGIKRSIGARRKDILLQFYAETFLVVAVGAVLGFLLSYGIVKLGAALPMEEQVGDPTLSPPVVAATLFLLGTIGFFAGLFPARKAANLDPVECLRY